MAMFAKLMSRITESSLMDEEIEVRYTFLMLLAIADPQGYVVGTDVAIARRLNMSLDAFQRCVNALMQPDPNSNSMEQEGRRVILSDAERGYFLVNYRKYRDTRDEEHRREYMREYMRKRRTDSDVARVNNGKQPLAMLAHAEGEAEGEAEAKGKRRRVRAVLSDPVFPKELDNQEFRDCWNKYVEYRRQKRIKALLPSSASEKLAELASYGLEGAKESIRQTIANGWQGLFPPKAMAQQKPSTNKTTCHYGLKETPEQIEQLKREMAQYEAEMQQLLREAQNDLC